jgi:hypothetical protein
MTVEHKRFSAAGAAHYANNTGSPWPAFKAMDLESAIRKPGRAKIRNPGLSSATRHEVRVYRVYPHQLS